jgi:hypothetical protein
MGLAAAYEERKRNGQKVTLLTARESKGTGIDSVIAGGKVEH